MVSWIQPYLKTFFILALVICEWNAAFCQDSALVSGKYGDPSFYLVDSLILEELTDADRSLLDSCLREYHKTDHIRLQLNALNKICEQLMHHSWAQYLWLLHNSTNKQLESGNVKDREEKEFYLMILAGTVGNIGFTEDEIGHTHRALEMYLECYDLYKQLDDESGMAAALNNIGAAYANLGDVEKGLNYHYQSLKQYESLGDKEGTSITLCNIAFIYEKQGEKDKAIEYFDRSLSLAQEINDLQGIAYALNNVGYIYEKQGDYQKALDNFNRSLEIRRELGDEEGIATSLNSIALIYGDLGDEKKALDFFRQGMEIREAIGDLDGLSYSLTGIAKIALNAGEIEEAEKIATKAYGISQELGYPENIASTAELLSAVYERQGKGNQALEMFKIHIQMRDSMHNAENERNVIQQQTRYEYEKKKLSDDSENQQRIVVEKEKQRLIIIASFIGLAALAIFIFVIYNRLKITRKQKRIIELVKREIELKNQEIHASINYAERIQQAVLPELRRTELFPDSFLIYEPKDIVSGDFYWWERTEEKLFFAVADCTGHGVPGGFMSMLGSIFLNEIFNSKNIFRPAEILNELSRLMEITLKNEMGETIRDGMDISFGCLDKETLKLEWAGANNPLYMIRSTQTGKEESSATDEEFHPVEVIKADKQPIGYFQKRTPFHNHEVILKQGDLIYLFSDGFADQFGGPDNRKFGYKRFKNVLFEMRNLPMEEQGNRLKTILKEWEQQGVDGQIDDVCVLGIRV